MYVQKLLGSVYVWLAGVGTGVSRVAFGWFVQFSGYSIC